jgi:hypothetical protein
MGGACSIYGERREVYRVLVEKPDGKRALVSLRISWKYNSKMVLQKVEFRGMDRAGSE